MLATANDESTPMMSVAAQTLLGETVEEVYLNENYNLMMFLAITWSFIFTGMAGVRMTIR